MDSGGDVEGAHQKSVTCSSTLPCDDGDVAAERRDRADALETDAKLPAERQPADVDNNPPKANKKRSSDEEVPPKKRKTRRGKAKRRNGHPYNNNQKGAESGNKNGRVQKAEAPYNSNRFLIEDHGNIEDLDERLKNHDQVSTSTVTRTRDSSFSIDSDGAEFYSTPDDEEEFLIKDFDDQYVSLQNERLHEMSKAQLIEEYLMLEEKIEMVSSSLKRKTEYLERYDFQKEIERLTMENERLRRENESLKSKMATSTTTSEDSESDSDDSSSSSGSCSSEGAVAPEINGHSSPPAIPT